MQVHVALLVAAFGLGLLALIVMIAKRVHTVWHLKNIERSQMKARLLAKTVEATFPADSL